MLTLRKAQDRGRAQFGWLDSRHTFSFGHYYDPEQMGFSALRVINDDVVAGGAGFDTHSHQNMEIISYVLEGVMEHKDSEGNRQSLPAGEFQLMSAGRGISHSEYNVSQSDKLRFLQIWIEPDVYGTQPGYQQKNFGSHSGLTTVISPSGEQGSLTIRQDASLHQLILEPGQNHHLAITDQRRVYLHQVRGEVQADDALIQSGDGARVEQESTLLITNTSDKKTLTLIFDLP
ncbi:pirin family protein [Parendozoicomonas haliclonae]|uniref:Quercetin 2,3-dioxygenase n=1 Tax=Parendozoicomonas haliclonae TaxID=1960125 RepID=A0A1X7ARP3_9GAMM|nr:pirin family protein [Parendozoicomonas haliclonae]SMA50769.1 Quercetin 2,3-dioxygenase [Parendozoicomonas haliclonae]